MLLYLKFISSESSTESSTSWAIYASSSNLNDQRKKPVIPLYSGRSALVSSTNFSFRSKTIFWLEQMEAVCLIICGTLNNQQFVYDAWGIE